MTSLEIAAQILGILALLANVVCYQLNRRQHILVAQILGSLFFLVNLGLQGAWAGAALNIHAILRLTVFYQREKHPWARHPLWVPFFCITALLCVAFASPTWLDWVALFGTMFTIVSFSLSDPMKIRLVSLPSPPCWFLYHFLHRNVGGFCNEIFVFSSAIIGFFRHDLLKLRQKKKGTNQEEQPVLPE